ncbi:MAG: T9SS type A sorting domain-containing protein [Prevotella sp.]|nr:T9SS type A sorting domain-containing protein [Prevotella sp.]
MNKRILTIIFSMTLMLGMPLGSAASQAIEIVDNDFQTVSISVSESVLHVANANGMILEIFNVAGVKVMSIKVEGQDKKFELNLPKGCYIVKVGKTVRKISIR